MQEAGPFPASALIFGTESLVHKMLLKPRAADIGKFLFQGALRPAFHPSYVRPGGILDNAVQPGGEARSTLELTEILEGQEKSLLHSVFAVLGIAKHLPCCPLKSRHAGCKKFVQLGGIHVARENGWPLELRTGCALLFNSQVASFGRCLKR